MEDTAGDNKMTSLASEASQSSLSNEDCSALQQLSVSCPVCSFASDSPMQVQVHMENEHFGSISDDEHQMLSPCDTQDSFQCPMCSQSFRNAFQLESHFNKEHDCPTPAKVQKRDTKSSASTNRDDEIICLDGPSTSQLSCPVCSSKGFADEAVLALHVEQHFSSHVDEDELLAQRLQADSRREELEFKRLQELYGFDGKTMDQQADKVLARAAQRGEISVVDYHEKRIMLKMAERDGLDDGLSITRDVIPRLKVACTSIKNVQRVWLCSPMDHFAASVGDSGWGCGYRNFQMLLSSLLRRPEYVDRLKRFCPEQTPNSPVQVCSITRLQAAIEDAWNQGFDPQGRDQLGGRVSGTTKWIGATEIASVLALCRIRYRMVDFHRPTCKEGTLHPALFDWVLKYFRGPAEFKPPLYFQHQGHSRTIVGIEESPQSKLRLLILDPSHKHAVMQHFMTVSESPPVLKRIRVPLSGLKAKQYQIVCVEDGFVDNDEEYLESRTLRSHRIP